MIRSSREGCTDPSAESLWGTPPAGGEPLCLHVLPSPWQQPSRQSMPDPCKETKAGTGLARPFSFRAPGGTGGLRSLWGFSSAQAAPAPAPKPPSVHYCTRAAVSRFAFQEAQLHQLRMRSIFQTYVGHRLTILRKLGTVHCSSLPYTARSLYPLIIWFGLSRL